MIDKIKPTQQLWATVSTPIFDDLSQENYYLKFKIDELTNYIEQMNKSNLVKFNLGLSYNELELFYDNIIVMASKKDDRYTFVINFQSNDITISKAIVLVKHYFISWDIFEETIKTFKKDMEKYRIETENYYKIYGIYKKDLLEYEKIIDKYNYQKKEREIVFDNPTYTNRIKYIEKYYQSHKEKIAYPLIKMPKIPILPLYYPEKIFNGIVEVYYYSKPEIKTTKYSCIII